MTLLETSPTSEVDSPVEAQRARHTGADDAPTDAGSDDRLQTDRPSIWLGFAAGAATAAPAGLLATRFTPLWQAAIVGMAASLLGGTWAARTACSPAPARWHGGFVAVVAATAATLVAPGTADGTDLSILFDDAFGITTDNGLLVVGTGTRAALMIAFAAAAYSMGWVATALDRSGAAIALAVLALVVVSNDLHEAAPVGVGAALAGGALLVAVCVAHASRPDQVASGEPVARRMARAAVLGMAVLGAVALLSRVDALFPEPASGPPPPVPPEAASPAEVHPVIRVSGASGSPLRAGALVDFDGERWLAASPTADSPAADRLPGGSTVSVEIIELDVPGVVPAPAGTTRAEGAGASVDADTGLVVAPAPEPGEVITLEVAAVPTALGDLAVVLVDADPDDVDIPDPPDEIVEVLDSLGSDPVARFEALRATLTAAFVAEGAGVPGDTPPDRVVELLDGSPGTPYERAAAEAMLARWAGLPARVGFGYVPELTAEDFVVVDSDDAAWWLEIRTPAGWAPFLPTGGRAVANPEGADGAAAAGLSISDEVPVELLLPRRRTDRVLPYERARDVAGVIVGIAASAGLARLGWPLIARRVRRSRRARWAAERGPAGAIAIAYADWRDTAIDLGIGGRQRSPLGFCDHVVDDAEHLELAWLTTRAMYGDLAGELTDADAAAAEELSRSLRRRLIGAAPLERRFLARISLSGSLTRPWTGEVPDAPVISRRQRRTGDPGRTLRARGAYA